MVQARDRHGRSRQRIRGLQPGTRYVYWLGQAESGRRYEFQTAPLGETPCWFLLTWGDVSDSIAALMVSELPEFAVSLTPIAPNAPDPLGPVRPFMPVYDPAGASSPYLRDTSGPAPPIRRTAWSLDWGGLRLAVIAAGGEDAAALLRSTGAHTAGIIYHAPSASGWFAANTLDTEAIKASTLHKAIAAHNAAHSEGKVAFVMRPSDTAGNAMIDGVRYVAISTAAAGAARVDVAPESSQLVVLTGDEPRSIALKASPLGTTRTCAECRRLANRGAYLKSIEAYKQFIADNEGHYQIDDAYYAIAELLDERLFQFAQALAWYERLIERYPDSALAPMARRRIAYLEAHNDADYAPLARFERIRRVRFARSQHDPAARAACLADAAGILEDYPDCSMAPAILYWLANQHRLGAPDGAAALYRTLLDRFPDSRLAGRAWLEMGETYYAAGQHARALAVFEEALAAEGANPRELATQMARARRNLRRGHLKLAAWSVMAVIGLGALLVRPVGMVCGGLRRAAGAFAAIALALLGGGWLIREQFASSGEMALLCLGLAAAAAVPAPLTATLGLKLCRAAAPGASAARRTAGALCGCALGLVFLAAGMYLLIYYVNEHYLIVAGL